MTFDWVEYLKVARELAGDSNAAPSEDAKLRAAISRAYYAAFNKARWHLRHKDFDYNIPQDGMAHEYVQRKFSDADDDLRRQKIGENLHQLHVDRKRADYSDTFARLSETTTHTLKLAGEVISLLEKL